VLLQYWIYDDDQVYDTRLNLTGGVWFNIIGHSGDKLDSKNQSFQPVTWLVLGNKINTK